MLLPPTLPFHALGYRCNPFGALTDEEWRDIALLPPLVATALALPASHLQLLGRMGSGKTTALRKIRAEWAEMGLQVAYTQLREDHRRIAIPLANLDALCLDEAQRMDRGQRGHLLHAMQDGLRVALGSHTNFAWWFARHHLPLTTIRLQEMPFDRFRAIIARRLDYFALSAAPRVSVPTDILRDLWQRHGNDLRASENDLYELFQNWAVNHG